MRNTPDFETCFAELIGLPSVSSIDPAHDQSNQAVIDCLANWLDALGFECEIMPVSDSPQKSNLIARLGHADDTPNQGLVLSGHTDTVPYDASGWDSDPFQLTERDGNYYGLGTADMKSYFPIILETLERMQAVNFDHPVTVIATADEESTMSGARLLGESGYSLGRYCVIGEPTGLKPIRAHKGIIIESFRLEGRSGHSSNPLLGNSALEGMTDVLNALRDWRDKLQKQYSDSEFAVPVPTLNLGRIHGGDSPNRICANCELSLDIRMLPGMDVDEISQQLRNVVESTIAASGLEIFYTGQVPGIPPMQTPMESEVVRTCEKHTGHGSECVAFATEGPFFNDIGIETVILGPGDIDVAHQPNEYLPIKRIEPMITILTNLLTDFCVTK